MAMLLAVTMVILCITPVNMSRITLTQEFEKNSAMLFREAYLLAQDPLTSDTSWQYFPLGRPKQ